MTSHEDSPHSDQAVRGVVWAMLERWGARGLSTVSFVVLSRLLAPEAFGLVALATVATGVLFVFVDQGFGQALVQRESVSPEHLDAGFWYGVITALGIGAILWIGAPWIASLMGDDELTGVLRWLTLVPLAGAGSSVPTALLTREMRFAALTRRTLFAAGLGAVVAVVMAFAGFGVWALVANGLVQAASTALATWLAVRWRPRFGFSGRHWKELWRFGTALLGRDLLGIVAGKADDVLIGRIIGTTALGFYSVGYRFFVIAQELLLQSVADVSIPVYSRLQSDPTRLQSAFCTTLRVVSLVSFPFFAALSLTAPLVVRLLSGDEWDVAGQVLQALSLVGLVHTVEYFVHTLFISLGRPGLSFRLTALNALANVVVFVVAVRHGVVAVAFAFSLRGYLLIPVVWGTLNSVAGIGAGTVVRQVGTPALASVVMGATGLAALQVMQTWPTAVRLGVALATCGVTYLVAVYALAGWRMREASVLVRSLRRSAQRDSRTTQHPPSEVANGDAGVGGHVDEG